MFYILFCVGLTLLFLFAKKTMTKKKGRRSNPQQKENFLEKWLEGRTEKFDDILKWSAISVAGLVLIHLTLLKLFPTLHHNWFKDHWWFAISNLGLLIIPIFWTMKENGKSSVTGRVVATVLAVILCMYFFQHNQAPAKGAEASVVKNIVMGLPVSPLEIEIPVAPRMLIINPGVTKGSLCYNNDLSIKMYHLSSQGNVVALFENVKGQEMREKGWKFPVLQSGGSLGFQAQGEKSVTAKMWSVPRRESCDY